MKAKSLVDLHRQEASATKNGSRQDKRIFITEYMVQKYKIVTEQG